MNKKKLRENFSQIYDKYIEKIYRFIFIKVNSQEITDDLCSETFLHCWEVFKKDQKKIENIQAFLYQIARNLIIDHYREKGRTQTVSADFVPIIDPNPGTNLEEKALLDSDLETVKAALSDLKEDYQNMIIWYYIEDLSVSEISDTIKKPRGTVRVMLHRALKALKNELENKSQTI